MSSNRFQHILFDVDNTLFDFDSAAAKAFSLTFESLNLQATSEDYREYQGINHTVWNELERGLIDKSQLIWKRWALILKNYGKEEKALEANAYFLKQLVVCSEMLEGALDMLCQLKKMNRNISLITNGFKEVQRPRVVLAGIEGIFDTIVVSDEIGWSKPHRNFFEFTLKQLNHPELDSILVVGDNLNSDIKGANQMGIKSCWYNPNGLINQHAIQPHFEVSSFAEIIDIVSDSELDH